MGKALEKPRSAQPRPEGTAHGEDLYAWVQEQVAHLRARRIDALDFDNIAEELGDVGKSEFRDLHGALAVVLLHMLKWEHQPERRSRSWANSIAEHRDRVNDALSDSPSLKSRRGEAIERAYRSARRGASTEMDRPIESLPAACPYSWEVIMGRRFTLDADGA
jgi:hypothetical protein